MSDNFAKTVGNTKKIKQSLERLDALEQAMTGLFNLLNKEFGELKDNQSGMTDVLNALIELSGVDEVQEVLNTKATEKRTAEEKAVQDRLDAGTLKTSDVVTYNSVVAYQETAADGAIRHPGKFHRNVASLAPQSAQAMVGKKVGDQLPLGNGGKVTVQAIYEQVTATPPVSAPTPEVPVVEAIDEGVQDWKTAPQAPVDAEVVADSVPL